MNTLAKISVRLAGLALAAAVLVAHSAPQALAQTSGWSDLELVFEGEGSVHLPALVADVYGQVHAFWVFRPTDALEPNLIYYTRLDQSDSQPVDILAGEGRGLMAAGTPSNLALLWNGTQHSMAGPSPAVSAKGWDTPSQLQPAYSNGGLTAASDGAFWAAFGGQDTNAVYVQRFDPVRQTWESPLLVANTSNVSAAPDAIRVAVGPDGSLHAVWAEYQLPDGWPPLGLYYSQSVDGGATWSSPLKVAATLNNQPNVKIGPNNEVFLAWTGAAGLGGKYIQESPDGGRTWNPVVDIVPPGPIGGSEGAPNLAFDSAGGLHMVFSYNSCVWHVSRQGTSWSAPECISTQPVHIEEPAMAIGLGNQIHVMYWTQATQLWYTAKTLPAPAIEALAVPTLPPPTPTVFVPTSTPIPTGTPLPDLGPLPGTGQAARAGLWALAAGVAPVVLLVLVVLAQRGQRRR